jgi:hypothetical protein
LKFRLTVPLPSVRLIQIGSCACRRFGAGHGKKENADEPVLAYLHIE